MCGGERWDKIQPLPTYLIVVPQIKIEGFVNLLFFFLIYLIYFMLSFLFHCVPNIP